MNKYTKTTGKTGQKSVKTFSEIGLYNQKVRDNLNSVTLDFITQHTIKLFLDKCQRNRLSQTNFNKAVEEFNKTHGFLIPKKGTEYEDFNKYYNYINYPFIDTECFKGTMDNYRLYVYNYNNQVAQENEEIRKYNNLKIELHHSLSEAQKKRKKEFEDLNKHLFTREYNMIVEKENKKDPIIPKKRIQEILPQHEITFQIILGFYCSQLRDRNANLMNLNKSTSVPKNNLPKLNLDQKKLADHKVKDIRRVKMSKRTAQNHIKTFREAKILVNYRRINQKKPIQLNFSSQILVLKDGKPPKPQTPNNQHFNPSFKKALPDNRGINIPLYKEKEIKDSAKQNLEKCGSITANNSESNNVPLAGSYKNTIRIVDSNKKTAEKNSLGRAEAQKMIQDRFTIYDERKNEHKKGRYQLLTDNVLANILDDRELAKRLNTGYFNNYTPHRYSKLVHIANYAYITSEQFKEFLIQDVIKNSAKIWSKHTVYTGIWKRAINSLKEQLFKGITQKETMINKLREYRWKLEWARKWFQKSKVRALLPHDYFDVSRTESAEIGFYGLNKIWKKNQEYKKAQELNNKNALHKANSRKRKISAQKKLQRAITNFYTGKYTYQKLSNYVKTNLPHEYYQKLHQIINNNLA